MWKYNNDYKKWYIDDDSITKNNFDYQKQELRATRFYSRCLSGSTYLPINDTSDLYDIMNKYQPRNWYINTLGSQYSISSIPSNYATPITNDNSFEYYTKYLSEYGLTLKNLFTPYRLIKDSSKNFYYVDVATTKSIDLLTFSDNYIDDIKLLDGHRILVKNQTTNIVLLNTTNPDTYFTSNYEIVENLGGTIEYKYYNNENGIYLYKNGKLIRDTDLDNYDNCIRYSVSVKMGTINIGKQFHLSRLLDGYFPTTKLNQPIEFQEKHNWILKNRLDYNNLFEINYYDIIKHGTQSYDYNGLNYIIPERTIAVGEYGIILNTQEGKSNIIDNKYKVNFRSICETTKYYWICGDDNILIQVNKYNFDINRIILDDALINSNIKISNFKSISFYDDLHGVIVGELNKILYTENGGKIWSQINIEKFEAYNYNKVLAISDHSFYVIGNNGVFIEFINTISGWTAYNKRISQIEDNIDEYILVDNINDMYKTTLSNWDINYNYFTHSISDNKELLFLVTDNNKFIAYDINNSFSDINNNFIYFNFNNENYNNIRNITQRKDTNYFYFNATDPYSGNDGIFEFNIGSFSTLGIDNLYSNTAIGPSATLINTSYSNKILDYNGNELLICGNNSLLGISTYSAINFNSLDPTFNNKLKSKLLFLDYDIASKLNFFTDNGEYRLPNSITFSNVNLIAHGLTSSPKISFEPIIHAQTTINNGTYSELNWITYWVDTQKTFEYYSNTPLSKSSEVLISTTFSYSQINSSATFTSSQISISISDIKKLAPSIIYATASRYSSIGISYSIIPVTTYDIYLYDYLMIYKVQTTYPVNIGDIIRIESSVVDANFIVNKIIILGSYKYIYMYTEFNQNIITELSKTTNLIKITNLNKYSNIDELKNRFNIHPISNAYKLDYTNNSDIFKLSAIFNNLTSYYNLQTSVNIYNDSIEKYDMIYSDNFLKFGYSPTYNLLDYLINISNLNDVNPIFYSNKEYLSMPIYQKIPIGDLTASNVYINYNGLTYSSDNSGDQIVKNAQDNKISFGKDLKLEWDSIFINTFVDVIIHDSVNDYITEKLLVMNKYYDSLNDSYVIEFHKRLNYVLYNTFSNDANLDIISRRKLYQISEDLQELNNIQKALYKLDNDNFNYNNYNNKLNFKLPTDSYAKILLSDVDTIQNLSGIIYIDYKNELAMNITKFIEQYEIQIVNIQSYNVPGDNYSKLVIECAEKHNLSDGYGVVLDFNDVADSSNYNGYHVITKINDYTLLTNINYTTTPIIGIDTNCYVRYTKVDPFLNYEPVDLIDLGCDLKGKIALELSADNIILSDNKFNLINVDYDKYRFRLIDGLNINIINTQFSWILEADLSNAVIGLNNNDLIWYKGTWIYGRWYDGIWMSGTWISGDWYGGTWNSYIVSDNVINFDINTQAIDIKQSFWYSGRWYDGTWNNGTWNNGRWYDGIWNDGTWYKGTWNNGTWNNGIFEGGIWVDGTWNNGIFNCNVEPAYWLYGKWFGGDFENGMWYNGIWEQRNNDARFGTKSSNSRTANWQAGVWVSGSFFSYLNIDDNNNLIVCDTHKYSIWKTGKWLSGEWYGGIAYNINFKTGTWYGGILEDIEVIGIDSINNAFILNGIFKFNINDEIYIIDNQIGNSYSIYGSNLNPHEYKIIYTTESDNKTIIYVNEDLIGSYNVINIDTGLRVISNFENINWKSGIWTNGLFNSGLWESGIWYNGIFNGIWS